MKRTKRSARPAANNRGAYNPGTWLQVSNRQEQDETGHFQHAKKHCMRSAHHQPSPCKHPGTPPASSIHKLEPSPPPLQQASSSSVASLSTNVAATRRQAAGCCMDTPGVGAPAGESLCGGASGDSINPRARDLSHVDSSIHPSVCLVAHRPFPDALGCHHHAPFSDSSLAAPHHPTRRDTNNGIKGPCVLAAMGTPPPCAVNTPFAGPCAEADHASDHAIARHHPPSCTLASHHPSMMACPSMLPGPPPLGVAQLPSRPCLALAHACSGACVGACIRILPGASIHQPARDPAHVDASILVHPSRPCLADPCLGRGGSIGSTLVYPMSVDLCAVADASTPCIISRPRHPCVPYAPAAASSAARFSAGASSGALDRDGAGASSGITFADLCAVADVGALVLAHVPLAERVRLRHLSTALRLSVDASLALVKGIWDEEVDNIARGAVAPHRGRRDQPKAAQYLYAGRGKQQDDAAPGLHFGCCQQGHASLAPHKPIADGASSCPCPPAVDGQVEPAGLMGHLGDSSGQPTQPPSYLDAQPLSCQGGYVGGPRGHSAHRGPPSHEGCDGAGSGCYPVIAGISQDVVSYDSCAIPGICHDMGGSGRCAIISGIGQGVGCARVGRVCSHASLRNQAGFPDTAPSLRTHRGGACARHTGARDGRASGSISGGGASCCHDVRNKWGAIPCGAAGGGGSGRRGGASDFGGGMCGHGCGHNGGAAGRVLARQVVGPARTPGGGATLKLDTWVSDTEGSAEVAAGLSLPAFDSAWAHHAGEAVPDLSGVAVGSKHTAVGLTQEEDRIEQDRVVVATECSSQRHVAGSSAMIANSSGMMPDPSQPTHSHSPDASAMAAAMGTTSGSPCSTCCPADSAGGGATSAWRNAPAAPCAEGETPAAQPATATASVTPAAAAGFTPETGASFMPETGVPQGTPALAAGSRHEPLAPPLPSSLRTLPAPLTAVNQWPRPQASELLTGDGSSLRGPHAPGWSTGGGCSRTGIKNEDENEDKNQNELPPWGAPGCIARDVANRAASSRGNKGLAEALVWLAGKCPNLEQLSVMPCAWAEDERDQVAWKLEGPKWVFARSEAAPLWVLTDRVLGEVALKCRRLRAVTARHCLGITDASVSRLATGTPLLAHLDLSHCPSVGDASIIRIAQGCPALEHLNVQGCGGRPPSLPQSANGVEPSLPRGADHELVFTRRVTAPGPINADDVDDPMTGSSSTTASGRGKERSEGRGMGDARVPVASAVVTDASLRALAQHCPRLTHVNLSECGVTDEGLSALICGRQKLAHLNMARCSLVSDDSISLLGKHCPLLEHLNVSRTRVADAGVMSVARGCPRLRGLILEMCDGVTDASVLALASQGPLPLASLETLDLSSCESVSSASVSTLLSGACPRLTSLSVGGTRVSDSGLQGLSHGGCPELDYLDARRCHRVTDVGMIAAAKGCPKLRYVMARSCRGVTDVGVKELSRRCPGLRYLNVRNCRSVSDDSILELGAACGQLEYLNVVGCPLVTAASKKALNCQVDDAAPSPLGTF